MLSRVQKALMSIELKIVDLIYKSMDMYVDAPGAPTKH